MINEQIRDKEVRVIGSDGEQLGIMSAKEAYFKAKDAGLDLVRLHQRRSRRFARLSIMVNIVMSWLVKQKKQRKNKKPSKQRRFDFLPTSTPMT